MPEKYDVLPMPTHLGAIRDQESNLIKPFVAIYFPDEILGKMKWTKETRLVLSVEKNFLKITKSESDDPIYFDINDLVYDMDEEF